VPETGGGVDEPAPPAFPVPPMLTRLFTVLAGRAMNWHPETGALRESLVETHWESAHEAEPVIGRSRLVIDHADGSGPRQAQSSSTTRKKAWRFHLHPRLPGRSWRSAPADLKFLSLALPAVLLLAVYSFLPIPSKKSSSPAAAQSDAGTFLGDRFSVLKKVIMERAAVKLVDDFRGGLGAWEGEENWAKSWQYTNANFVAPGQLAIYAPSLKMKDYTFAFIGQIEKRSLNWVLRAQDPRNYYAMRILITRGGPLPTAVIARYAVINGVQGPVTTLPLPLPIRSDTLYQVQMEIEGDTFVTYVQNQVVDTFTDRRLNEGGIGFFSPKGDRALLRWVSVIHQYDYLGRLCALLAPYSPDAEKTKTK
jgi:hypothetical protein